MIKSNYKRIGIPLSEVGKRLEQLNEAIKGNNMAIKADSKIELELECSGNETALAVTLAVYLFDDREDKENG